jgi:hypothetical protein
MNEQFIHISINETEVDVCGDCNNNSSNKHVKSEIKEAYSLRRCGSFDENNDVIFVNILLHRTCSKIAGFVVCWDYLGCKNF